MAPIRIGTASTPAPPANRIQPRRRDEIGSASENDRVLSVVSPSDVRMARKSGINSPNNIAVSRKLVTGVQDS